jgi:hypothetical protein
MDFAHLEQLTIGAYTDEVTAYNCEKIEPKNDLAISTEGNEMRVSGGDQNFAVQAIAGTRAILIAIDCSKDNLVDLKGFAFQRAVSGKPPVWLLGNKVFRKLDPNPKAGASYPTN